MTQVSIPLPILLLVIFLMPVPARAVKVADITRIGGERTNILTGLGLVYGLKGTGDGGSFTPAIAPLRSMLAKFGDPVTMQELGNAANVAVVMVTATVPAAGRGMAIIWTCTFPVSAIPPACTAVDCSSLPCKARCRAALCWLWPTVR